MTHRVLALRKFCSLCNLMPVLLVFHPNAGNSLESCDENDQQRLRGRSHHVGSSCLHWNSRSWQRARRPLWAWSPRTLARWTSRAPPRWVGWTSDPLRNMGTARLRLLRRLSGRLLSRVPARTLSLHLRLAPSPARPIRIIIARMEPWLPPPVSASRGGPSAHKV